MSEAGGSFPEIVLDVLDSDEQRRTRIAWLYYVENRTQAEIANLLGLNRIKVNRDLAACRESGMVQIRINGRLSGCVALERALCRRYGLADAVVVPTPQDAADIPAAIGLALGAYVSDRLREGMTVGIGWGRTLRWGVRAMARRRVPGLIVVSLMGGLGRASEINTYETASRFADRHEAACYYLAAPSFAGSAQLRDLLLEHAGLKQVCERARRADITLASTGALTPDDTIWRLGLLSEDDRQSLRAAGAAGDLLGTYLDAEGRIIDHPVNRRVVGVSPEELAVVPLRVLASGGAAKVAIIRACLVARHITVLLTDERTAAALADKNL